ncbi:hypothetical protein B5924_04170 [Salmonella enterica subsp. enterica serovar Dublin]|nr:hypothetical protein [Salmonella enterica subsp. enterica serovar Dublin]
MNDVLNSGAFSLASLIVSMVVLVVVLVVGLALWFFVNRASSRANEQIELLEALLDQQKRQNALLRRLCEANEPEKEAEPATAAREPKEDEDIIRLVAER